MLKSLILKYEASYDNFDKTNMVNVQDSKLLCFIRFWTCLSGQNCLHLRAATLRDKNEPN